MRTQPVSTHVACTALQILGVAEVESLRPYLASGQCSVAQCVMGRARLGDRAPSFHDYFREYIRANNLKRVVEPDFENRATAILNRISLRFFGHPSGAASKTAPGSQQWTAFSPGQLASCPGWRTVKPSADSIIRAIKAYSCLDDHGRWTDLPSASSSLASISPQAPPCPAARSFRPPTQSRRRPGSRLDVTAGASTRRYAGSCRRREPCRGSRTRAGVPAGVPASQRLKPGTRNRRPRHRRYTCAQRPLAR